MPDDSSIRMYSRSRGGRNRPGAGDSAKRPNASSASDSLIPSSAPSIDGTSRTGVNESETRQIFEKYHREMGVSTYALRAMFRQTKFSDLKNLDKHITSAQLARISSYSRGRRKQFEERLNLENLSGMDEYLLDFAFSIRPIDTLFEFVDLNLNDADVRTLRNCFAEEDTLEETALPDDVRLKEILLVYQDILQREVHLLSGVNPDDKTSQIKEIAQLARQCFDKIRSMMAENKFRAVVHADDTSKDELEESTPQESECHTSPQRITKKTMEKYKQDRGG